MYRVTVKIERLPMVARRGPTPTEETSAELTIQAKVKLSDMDEDEEED